VSDTRDTATIDGLRMGAVERAVASDGLSMESMIGSWFHGYNEYDDEYSIPTFQGRVVAEVQPGTYLCVFLSYIDGKPTHQELVDCERMVVQHWRFYDTSDWMDRAFQTQAERIAS
jgi:hypothetical protein